jgi:hypothetical protein
MNRFYIYKMTVDDGGAPCIQDRLLSLAICKPRIRSTAEKGDVILGFASNELGHEVPNNGLIYVAEVTAKICGERYYSLSAFSRRPDCIYLWDGKRFSHRRNAKFHHGKDDLAHDLGPHPGYRNAEVLLSTRFRYFRDKCPIGYKDSAGGFPALAALVDSLARGERVNHPTALRMEIERLLHLVWRRRSAYAATHVPKGACYNSCRDDKQKLTVC